MPETVEFFVVDVFAERPLTGNPLTLVPDADDLDVEQMRAVARELKQSETTFVVRPTLPGADVRLRSFTPSGAEVGGVGHHTLGAWLWLAAQGRFGPGHHHQEVGGSVLPVEVATAADGGVEVVMEQQPPVQGRVLEDVGPLAEALGLPTSSFASTPRPQVVSTGAGHLLVAVEDAGTVDGARPGAGLLHVLAGVGGEGCYVWTRDAPDGTHASARFFNPTMGIGEDPATGTAAGPLAVLLTREGLVAPGTEVVVEQGRAIGRPSRLRVRVDGERVRLVGSGLVVGEGRLRL
ncbi:PhzF family phenazine biosynthesis protein [Phycicoccus avicenniae]|uniref:PhzF family phenazine biosynthesis protein n=1 Tax=Phycicoccus avicenniae TaxID=2828860 RepID=UPI003D2E3559